ncbi:S24 family peptidase [Peredibacter sp. HCB2-198]|uniref:S24 family peptidase n=1 Tax=Peredibacter sp. HCB2-198 TaxID=3383025 RepID=UPI0038B6158B
MHQEEFEYEGQTGFQSACTEYAQKTLSLDELFALKAPNIYLWRASGGQGKKFHIKEGDIVIVDRKLNRPKVGHLYVVIVGSEFHLGEYTLIQNKPFLVPQMICLQNEMDFEAQIWGGIVAIVNIYSKPEGIG